MDSRRKRLLYRSTHCGMIENDILLGCFASRNLSTMSETDLDDFELLLAECDNDLYNWITGKEALPAHLDSPVMAAILAFRKWS